MDDLKGRLLDKPAMSAAAKLKQLQKRLTPAPWASEDGELYCDIDGVPWPLGFANGNALTADLRNALPQIVALVEFSEAILGSLPRSQGPTMAQILRELDEALGDVT